ncbi:hypothetical protein [Streptomyces virginiae]
MDRVGDIVEHLDRTPLSPEIASSSGGSDLRVLSRWRSLRRIVEADRFAAEDLRRFGVYRAGSGGLLPWADTYAPCQIYWAASDGPPEERPIVAQDSEGDRSTHSLSSSEFPLGFPTDHQFPVRCGGIRTAVLRPGP